MTRPPLDPLGRRPFATGRSAPLVAPLMPSVVWKAAGPDDLDALYAEGSGYTYAREGHPNADALGARIDALEGAAGGIVTGSGMAAVTLALWGTLRAGDRLLAAERLYGRSMRMLAEVLPAMGIAVDRADATDGAGFAAALRPGTRAILIETVSNPDLRVADLDAIAAAARGAGATLIVDATFSTPRALRVLERGADVVVQSVTKLMAGHSDVTLGYVGLRDPARIAPMRALAVTLGLTPSPFDCWLAERGLLTFALRHDRAEATARMLADAVAGMAGVARVLYPGRADHPDHDRARQLFGGRGGALFSFEVAGGRAAANALVAAMPEVAFAPTLGDVATTLSHPATSSHRALTPEGRAALGLSEGFFRVSVGIEEPEMLRDAFARGIAAARAAA
jgi:cystathionine gamma-synthase